MNNSWTIKKLGEIADLQNGYAFKSSDYIKLSNTLNFRMSNIRPDGTVNINYNPKYLPDSYVKKYKEFLLKDGDIVIAMTDMANEPKILGLPTIIKTEGKSLLLNQRVGKFININEKEIFIPFLRYYLSTNIIKNYYKSLGGGGLQINISKQNILSVKIPLPVIEEQKRIVKKLEKILAKIEASYALRQESVKDAELILKSAIYDYFSITTAKREDFRDVAILERGKFTPRPRNDPKYFGGSIPWIQIGDITNKEGKYITTYSGTLNEQGLAVSRMFNAGTVVTSIAASIGTTGILRFDSAFPDSLIGIQGKEVLNSYVYYYLLFMQAHLNFIAPQVAQKNINLKILGDLEIPVPDLKEQEKIVVCLDSLSEKVQALQKLQQEQLQDLEALKQSILHQAFQGGF